MKPNQRLSQNFVKIGLILFSFSLQACNTTPKPYSQTPINQNSPYQSAPDESAPDESVSDKNSYDPDSPGEGLGRQSNPSTEGNHPYTNSRRPSDSVIIANPNANPTSVKIPKSPPPFASAPPKDRPAPDIIIPVYQSPLTALPFWNETDHRPALSAFKNTCVRWSGTNPQDMLSQYLPEYGTFADWKGACDLANMLPNTKPAAKQFFEREFIPVRPKTKNKEIGLLTGYYQPEIDVRTVPNAEFSEPILAKPKTEAVQKKPRGALSAKSSRVIAYGRPMDVFFMQIQGSGHIRFPDGRSVRAAYNGNNGYPYASIGRVLINRGQLTKNRSSKRDIENWMQQAGPEKSREVMNQNKRYIFFIEQAIKEGEGPMGAMRVPLTAMGSIAVDPRYMPYGVPAYIVAKVPQNPGDYVGTESGQLVIAQDTGKAIKGALRGDLYFGSGLRAGALAGVMKHKAAWRMLLPRALAARQAPIS